MRHARVGDASCFFDDLLFVEVDDLAKPVGINMEQGLTGF